MQHVHDNVSELDRYLLSLLGCEKIYCDFDAASQVAQSEPGFTGPEEEAASLQQYDWF